MTELESIFLSYSFSKPEDRVIVAELEDVFRSLGLLAVPGLNLGGEQLTDAVKARIRDSDGLVALASRRDQLASGAWVTHPWIRDEYGYAKSTDMNAILLLENGVANDGAYASHEYIPFDRSNLTPALLKLAKTPGIWKDRAGNYLKVLLLPDDLLENLQSPSFQYQYISRGDSLGWQDVRPVKEPGGLFLHLNGARDGYLIEVKVSSPGGVRLSKATAQAMPITVE